MALATLIQREYAHSNSTAYMLGRVLREQADLRAQASTYNRLYVVQHCRSQRVHGM